MNSLDAVPHGWTGIATLPSLYAAELNSGQPLTCIGFLVSKVLDPALNNNAYADLQRVTFGGFFNESLQPPVSGATCSWLAQAIWQHIPAYFQEIVPDLQSQLPAPTLPGKICVAFDAWCDKQRS